MYLNRQRSGKTVSYRVFLYFEGSQAMENMKKYDLISDFNQGVAIVVKDKLYGAILMGGHEIIPPIYDYISSFKDGYAEAVWKGQCQVLDLSGRKCVKNGRQFIAVPDEYDYVRDFKDGLACVCVKGKWGVIDVNCEEIVSPQFYYISDFTNGTAKYVAEQSTHRWGYINSDGECSKCQYSEPIIEPDGNLIVEETEELPNAERVLRKVRINNKGQLIVHNASDRVTLPAQYSLARDFHCGLSCVQNELNLWGAVKPTGELVVPLQFKCLQDFKENKSFGVDRNGNLCLIASTGIVIKILKGFSDAQPYENGYAKIYKNSLCGLIDSQGNIVLAPIATTMYWSEKDTNEIILLHENKKGSFNVVTKLLIKPIYIDIIGMEKNHAKVVVDGLGVCKVDFEGRCIVRNAGAEMVLPDWCVGGKDFIDGLSYAISDKGKWGIVDCDGNTVCEPIYDNLGDIVDGKIITELRGAASKRVSLGNGHRYGLYNIETKVLIPAVYDSAPLWKGAFYLVCAGGLLGILDKEGHEVLSTRYTGITIDNGHFVLKQPTEGHYSATDKFGLATMSGHIVFTPQFQEIVFLGKGCLKMKRDNKWWLYNVKGEQVSKYPFEEILGMNKEGVIQVVLYGLTRQISHDGNWVIRSDEGKYINLPSKFSWGNDFVNGVAKVLIGNSENYVDSDFNIVLYVDGTTVPIQADIDKIVSFNEDGTSVFQKGEKVGLLSRQGAVVIDAKYTSLQCMQDGVFAASKNENGQRKYGVINMKESVLVPFECVAIGLFIGKTPLFYGAHSDHLANEYPKKNIEYWWFYEDNYGLMDSSGRICLPPRYQTIQEFANGFLVESDGKWGVFDSTLNQIMEPKYNVVSPFVNGFAQVKIVSNKPCNFTQEVIGVIDIDGKEKLEPVYQFIGKFQNGRAIIRKDNLSGLIDESYNILAEPQYSYISAFNDGKATVDKCIYTEGNPQVMRIRGTIDENGVFTKISASPFSSKSKQIVSRERISEDSNLFIISERTDSFGHNVLMGVADVDGNWVIPAAYSSIAIATDHLLWLYQNERVGLATVDGKILFESKYGKVEPFVDGYAKVNYGGNWYNEEDENYPHKKNREYSGGKWGVIDIMGREIVPAVYESVEKILNEEYFRVTKSLWYSPYKVEGLVNKNGEAVIKDSSGVLIPMNKAYDWQESYEGKRSAVYWNGYVGSVNEAGQLLVKAVVNGVSCEVVLPAVYDWGCDSVCNCIIVIKNGKQGLILDNDNEIIELLPVEYYKITYIGYGLFATQKQGERLSIINSKGDVIFSNEFDKVLDFGKRSDSSSWKSNTPKVISDSSYAIVCKDRLYGVLNRFGELILPPTCKSLSLADHGLILADGILIDNKRRRCVVNGDNVIPIYGDYDSAEGYLNGMITVSKGGLFGCINSIGTIVIPIVYNKLTQIGHDLLLVSKWDEGGEYLKTGVINMQNEVILPLDAYSQEIKVSQGLLLYCKDECWGAYSLNGKFICNPNYHYVTMISETLIKVGKNGVYEESYEDYESGYGSFTGYREVSVTKWGLIDSFGNEILPLEYNDIADTVVDGRIKIRRGSYEGYVDISGRIILKPIYNGIWDFVDGYAIVWNDCKYGVINSAFEEIIPCCFSEMEYEQESGLFKTEVGYKTKDGRYMAECYGRTVLVKSEYKHCYAYHANRAIAVCYKGDSVYYGLIDENSMEVLPPIFQYLFLLECGLYKFKLAGRYGLADAYGNILLHNKYHGIGTFEDGLACVISRKFDTDRSAGSDYGYIDEYGDEVLPVEYEFIGKRNNKTAVVMKNNVWGLFNVSTRTIKMLDKAAFIGSCLDGLCRINIGGVYNKQSKIAEGGKWGYINSDGIMVITPIYDYAYGYSEGMAAVKSERKYGFINLKGDFVVPAEYDGVEGHFKDGNGSLLLGGEVFVFDKNGCIVSKYGKGKECDNTYYYDEDDSRSYSQYNGYNGYDDQTINEAFEGDPSLIWNID